MSEYSETSIPEPLVFAPAHQTAQQLFVLLHDNAADPAQLEQLKKALMKAFPQAVLVLPYGPLRSQEAVHHWFDQAELGEHNYVGRVERALPDLIRYIQKVQTRFELTGEATALAGFGQGATIALEASMAQPDLAGQPAFYPRAKGMSRKTHRGIPGVMRACQRKRRRRQHCIFCMGRTIPLCRIRSCKACIINLPVLGATQPWILLLQWGTSCTRHW